MSTGSPPKRLSVAEGRQIMEDLLTHQFEVTTLLERDIGIRLSRNLMGNLINDFMGSGRLSREDNTTRLNAPWMLLYHAERPSLVGERITGHGLRAAIEKTGLFELDAQGVIQSGTADLRMTFLHHRDSGKPGGLQSMELVVLLDNALPIHQQWITFDAQEWAVILGIEVQP